jgi:outer membrane protein OmpA-like peptidoglycan-associated protein
MRTKKRSAHDHETSASNESPGVAAGKRARTDALVQRKKATPPVVSADLAVRRPDFDATPRADESFVESLLGPVQRNDAANTADENVHEAARAGVSGPSHELPHLDKIQASFGPHDVTDVKAHSDAPASAATASMGAAAFATGDHVAFASTPDLHTTAHEAAHVVQQRAGVHLKGGVGQAGDPYEQQADAVADAVVRGESAEPLLNGFARPDSAAGGAERPVQRRVGPDKARLEEPGHKERGWIRRVGGGGGEPPHVGSLYFRTKEYRLESDELALLAELARMYGPYARRGLTTPGAQLGLDGRIIGYADPRSSSRPDNDELSHLRASIVARELIKAFVRETRLSEGHFAFERVAAGVAPDAPAVTDDVAEANLLAPFRRADIHISGRAADPVPDSLPTGIGPSVPGTPDYRALVHGYDRWAEAVKRGDRGIINGIAAHIEAHFQFYGEPFLIAAAGVGVTPIRPPWWDSRKPDISITPYASMGRSARRNADQARDAMLKAEAAMLIRDFKEYAFYMEEHKDALANYRDEIVKAVPDQDKVDRLVQPLGHLLFMSDELKKSTVTVNNLSD